MTIIIIIIIVVIIIVIILIIIIIIIVVADNLAHLWIVVHPGFIIHDGHFKSHLIKVDNWTILHHHEYNSILIE